MPRRTRINRHATRAVAEGRASLGPLSDFEPYAMSALHQQRLARQQRLSPRIDVRFCRTDSRLNAFPFNSRMVSPPVQ